MAGLSGSLAFHACILLLIWLLAGRETVRPMQGTAAITVQLVTLAQMQAETAPPKQESLTPAPPVTRSGVTVAKKHLVKFQPEKNAPTQPEAHTETSKPEQQWQEARLNNHGATIIYQPMPKIPDDLRREAFNTYATARFHIAVDGSATVELLTPSQNPRLNRLLLEALKTWRFAPATDGGNPIASLFDIRVRFAVE